MVCSVPGHILRTGTEAVTLACVPQHRAHMARALPTDGTSLRVSLVSLLPAPQPRPPGAHNLVGTDRGRRTRDRSTCGTG